MKIKQIKNDKINSFEFSYNLNRDDYLKKILSLYQINEIYICIYGFDNEYDLTKLQIKKMEKSSQCFILNISINELSNLFSKINNNFDELTIWSTETNWEIY